MVLESRVLELTRENTILKSELYAIKDKFGLSQSTQFQVESDGSIISGLSDNRGRRDKIIKTIITTGRLSLFQKFQLETTNLINTPLTASY